ncbi:hypothetical protein DL98DRAFT_101551 [Cadophora sp. DSE1049]|nr:hypothetical protein DL98DRAFT_101551 [Cadophora sp. DSE1049]
MTNTGYFNCKEGLIPGNPRPRNPKPNHPDWHVKQNQRTNSIRDNWYRVVLPTRGNSSVRNTLPSTMESQTEHAAPGSDTTLLGRPQNYEQQYHVDTDSISRFCGPRKPIDRATKPPGRQNENRLDKLKEIPFATGRVGNLPPLHDDEFGQVVPNEVDEFDENDERRNEERRNKLLLQWRTYIAHVADRIGEMNIERLKEGVPASTKSRSQDTAFADLLRIQRPMSNT